MQRIHTATTDSAAGERWLFELVPSMEIPEVDLNVSLRSHFIKNQSIQRFCRTVSASRVTFIAYLISLAVGTVIFFVPASSGQILALVVTATGLPGAFAAIGNLRYDLVRLLIKTYDVWFFSCVCTVFAISISTILNDQRALLGAISWISCITNNFMDASIVGQRSTLIANTFSVVWYIVMGVTLSLNTVSQIRDVSFIRVNGHALPAIGVFRDSLVSIVAVLLRNIYRRSDALTRPTSLSHPSFEAPIRRVKCVSLRCKLRIQPCLQEVQRCLVTPLSAAKISTSSPAKALCPPTKTRLYFTPFLEPVDVRNTLLPSQWLWKSSQPNQLSSQTSRLVTMGATSFVTSNACFLAGLLAPPILHEPAFRVVTGLAASVSVVFVTVCLATAQRQVFRALATSFDFIFIGFQGIIVHFSLLDMCHWQPVLVTAFVSDFVWNIWIISWDAILPPVRSRLGLAPRFAAWIGLGLLLFRMACGLIVLFILKPHQINDREILKVEVGGAALELRPISWYVSCNVTIFSWAARIMWRLWFARDTDLVVLDGPVTFERPRVRKEHGSIAAFSPRPVTVGPSTTT